MNHFSVEDPRKTAVETVVDRIKTLLIEKKLNPGDLIPSETILAESLKTSRGSIREAMKILSAYGIVEIKQGMGTFISKAGNPKIFDPLLFKILIDNFDYSELIEIREIMERGIIEIILNNANAEEFQLLENIMIQLNELESTKNENDDLWNNLDLKYHRTMGHITHNKIVSNMYDFIIELFAPTIHARLGFLAHSKLHDAIMAKNKALALEMLTLHTSTWKSIHYELSKGQ